MIFGNIHNLQEYAFLEEKIKKCLTYALKHDLKSFEKGRYEIDGNELYVNVVEYQTASVEEHMWEAHKKYIDLHLMLCGREQIDLSFVQNMQLKEYVEKNDFLPMDGEKNCSVVLHAGDFLVCNFSDAHRIGIAVEGKESIKKAIFKIKI